MAADPTPVSRWPQRLAWATLAAAVPLLLFGGTVTTLEAGMAIDGWLVLEPGRGDHFLFFFPVEKWFRDAGTFVEHSHRLLGSLVGFLAIGTVLATFLGDRRVSARALSVAALLAVCAQGVIGGLRVLENSGELAFLHGALGQAVFAVLAATAIGLSPRWRASAPATGARASGAQRLALISLALVYTTIFLGAWLRHSASFAALILHLALMLAATGALIALAARLKMAAGTGAERLLAVRRGLLALLGAQLALGALSFLVIYVTVGPTARDVRQAVFPTLHVLFGGLLLAQCVSAVMWTRRLLPVEGEHALEHALEPGIEAGS